MSTLATLATATMLLILMVTSGCGGGGGPSSNDDLPVDLPELLTKEKPITGIDSNKTVYKKGETIKVWLWVRNDGSKTRTLSLHRRWDQTDEYAYSHLLCFGTAPRPEA